jgi:hypothetical protein
VITPIGGRPKHADVQAGRHRVSIRTPHPVDVGPDEAWWPTPEEARVDYERQKAVLAEGDGSALFKVSLYIDENLEDEHFVVRAIHNRL